MTDTLAARMKALVSQLNLHARNHVDPMSAWEWCAEELAPLAAEAAALERQHFDEVHWLSGQKNDLQARLDAAEEEWRRGAVLRTRTYETQAAKASAREAAYVAALERIQRDRCGTCYSHENAKAALTAAPERARALAAAAQGVLKVYEFGPSMDQGVAEMTLDIAMCELRAALGMEVGDEK
jgi:hypothetical protein